MTQLYKPGLHLLLTIRSVAESKLTDVNSWTGVIGDQISRHGLQNVGEVVHQFPHPGGYTAVHCLTESHISVHTWPEFGVCTCDIFLSNYLKQNESTVRAIAQAVLGHYGSEDFDLKEVMR